MVIKQSTIGLHAGIGSQHPTFSTITRDMKKEGLRPYMWVNMPNHRYAVRSHGYDKVLYVMKV